MTQTLPATPSPPRGRPLLAVRGVSFEYAGVGLEVLRDINLEVNQGEVIAVVGPSGCGKSTLLSTIVGSLEPRQGSVEWCSAADGKRRMVTMLFQRDTLLPWKSVQGNIDFALQFAGISKQEAADRADRLLELAGLTAFRGTRPAHLSGGMRRRAGLVVAIAPWPELVVMDEPFSSVDEPTRVEIHKSILDIARDSGISLLIVTHDVAEAVTLASRVYVLSRRPSACVAEYDVPFGQDRDVYKLRETPQYHELYSTIWHRLREEIQKPRQPEGEEA